MFVNLTFFALLVDPCTTLPSDADVADSVVAVTPVPLNGTDAVFAGLDVSVRTSVALRGPSTDGLNCTVMLHVAPGFTAPEQVLAAMNSAFDGTAVNARTAAPVFVRVIVFAPLVVVIT